MNAEPGLETIPQPETSIGPDGKIPSEPVTDAAAIGSSAVQRARVRFKLERRHEFRYHLSVACALACSWFVRLVPPRPRDWIADRGGDFFYRFSPTYRRNVSANI